MSYIDAPSIKSFVKENSWLSDDTPDAGTSELILQIDSIIFNKTKIPIPDDADTTPGILKNIACALLVYFSSGKAGEYTQDERLRRAKLYDDAMKFLNDVEAGRTAVYDNDGNQLSTSKALGAYFSSNQYITDGEKP